MNKTTLAALGVFAVLLVAVLATREKNVSVGIKKLALAPVDKTLVTRVELSGAKTALLKKDGANWTVSDPAKPGASFPVDDGQVTSLLDGVAEFKAPDFVSDLPERLPEFELEDGKGQRVQVFAGDKAVLDVVLGKAGKTGGTYVRENGKNAVFAGKTRLGMLAKRDVAAWRKKQLVTNKVEEFASVTVTPKSGQAFTVETADGKEWKLKDGTPTPAGFRFDMAAAGRIASSVANLRTQEFLDGVKDQDPITGLNAPHDVVEAKLKDGKTITIHLGPEGDTSDGATAYQVKGALEGVDGNKDGKLSVEELKAAAGDAAKTPEVKKALAKLAEDKAAFDRFDVGGWSRFPADGALSVADLEGVSKTASLFPLTIQGDAQVYLAPSYAGQALRKQLSDLRDLTLLGAFDPAKVTQLSVAVGPKKTVATKVNGAWTISEPKTPPAGLEIDPGQVVPQLTMLKGLRASRVVEPAPKPADSGLGKPTGTVVIKLEDGKTHTLTFGKDTTNAQGAKEVFVAGSADGAVYAVGEFQKKRLETGVELFKKLAPPPGGRGGMMGGNGLDSLPPDIRKKLEAQMRAQGM